MNVKVTKEFVDKYSHELHKVGDVFEADDARIAEINKGSVKYIQVVEDEVSTADDVVETVAPEKVKKVGERHGK